MPLIDEIWIVEAPLLVIMIGHFLKHMLVGTNGGQEC